MQGWIKRMHSSLIGTEMIPKDISIFGKHCLYWYDIKDTRNDIYDQLIQQLRTKKKKNYLKKYADDTKQGRTCE